MQRANGIAVAFGLLTAALGSVPLLALLGVLPSRPPAPGDAPVWLGLAIGLMFFLAGILMIVRGLIGASNTTSELPQQTPRALRAFDNLLVMPIPVLLAAVLSWVAFGPGERNFTVSGGSGGGAMATGHFAGGEIPGRIAFGLAALAAWFLIGRGILTMVRRQRG